jgi:AAA domain-containing protein
MASTTRVQPKRSSPARVLPPKKPAAKAVKSNGQPSDKGFYGKPAVTIFSYGPSGVGKTSLWAHMPGPMFIVDPQEEGIEDLVEFKQAPEPAEPTIVVEDFETCLEKLAEVAGGGFKINSLIMDSATGFEKLCFQYHCATYFENDWSKGGFYAFQQGPKNAAKTDWPRFLDALDMVRRAGINVVLIGHSQVKAYNNPEGPDYDQFLPYLDKETWQQTHRWAKAVLFYNHNAALEKQGLKNKPKAGAVDRFLYTTHSATYAAKNRWGLEPAIDAGESGEEAFANFLKAFEKASK